MKLIIKQCKQDYRARFLVFNESGEERYHILGEQKSRDSSLSVRDTEANVLAQVRQRSFLFLSGYGISVAGINCATMIQNLYNQHTMLRVAGADWSVRGDVRTRNFDLVDREGSVVMTHMRRWGVWGDGYEINLLRPEWEMVCLCIALCIDWTIPMDNGTVVAINS